MNWRCDITFIYYWYYKMENFIELKEKCKEVWWKYEWRPWGYYEEKIERVNSITNPEDAFFLINMFDTKNQAELWSKLSDKCKKAYGDYFLVNRLYFYNNKN